MSTPKPNTNHSITKSNKYSSKSYAGFTLVELIVVITILVILGTIAFISLGGFSWSARDSSRVSDAASISKGLNISFVKNGVYPDPTAWSGITYSGSVVWKQGTIWDSVISAISNAWVKISKKPVDPLSNNEYTYSITTETKEYSIKTDYEGDRVGYRITPASSLGTPLARGNQDLLLAKGLREVVGLCGDCWKAIGSIDSVNAATGNPQISYIAGNYNGVATKVTAGTSPKVVYLIAVPNIVTTSSFTGVMVGWNQNFITNGSATGGILFTPTILYQSGALPANDTERVVFGSGIVNAYSGTSLATNSTIAQFIVNAGNTGALASAGGNLVSTVFGGSAGAAVAVSTSSSAGGYSIGNSLMFNSVSNQFLSRAMGAGWNQKKWTWSGWVKRGKLGTDQAIFGTEWSNLTQVYFNTNDKLRWYDANWLDLVTSAVFRDPSAWYHIILSLDTTQSPWAKIFVNWQLITSFSTTSYPTTGTPLYVNSTDPMGIGRVRYAGGGWYFWYADSYFSNIDFVDSWALDASYFWITNANGQWVPQPYTGDYGINWFHLDFSSGATTTTLGKDSAPLTGTHLAARDWTPNGYADTSSQVIDTPTNNFVTLNPLHKTTTNPVNGLANGNLAILLPSTQSNGYGTIGISSGRWYAEVTVLATGAWGGAYFGITQDGGIIWLPSGHVWWFNSFRDKIQDGSYSTMVYPAWNVVGKTAGIAFDADSGSINLYASGILVWTMTGITVWPTYYFTLGTWGSSYSNQINFGQWGQLWLTYDTWAMGYFKYTPTSLGLTGYKALSVANLPSTTTVTSGSFTGNTNTDWPFIFTNGAPTSLTINNNPVQFGTGADRTAGGFKIRSALTLFNSTGTNTWTGIVTVPLKYANGQTNP